MPLGVKEIVLPDTKRSETNPKKAAYRLLQFEKELYSDTIHRKRKRRQAAPIIDDDEGFENSLTPIDQNKFEVNGLRGDNESSDVEGGSGDESVEATEEADAEAFHISNKRNNKKISKKLVQPNPLPINELAKKVSCKKQKKQKFLEEEVEGEETTVNLKVKNKNLKMKKMQGAINFFNEKLPKRSSEYGSLTKVKKSRLSIDNAWDVSSNDDPATPTALSPKSKGVKSPVTKCTGAKDTSENIKQSSNNPAKEQLNKIPWLIPVLTKLGEEKVSGL